MFGVYGSFHQWNGITIWRSAAEAELYVNRFSLSGLAGFEGVDVPTFSDGLQVLNTDDDHFFGHVDLAYYPIDDLKIYGGYRYINETSLGAAGAEYLLRDHGSPISLFAKATFGDNDYDRITVGLKAYFGAEASKSLMSRHRTEDPQNYTPVFPVIVMSNTMSNAPTNQCVGRTVTAGGRPGFRGNSHYDGLAGCTCPNNWVLTQQSTTYTCQ